MDDVAPHLRKFLALTMLAVALWLLVGTSMKLLAWRMAIRAQIADLKQIDNDIIGRRVDIKMLEERLRNLTAAPATQQNAIVADTERSAVARLQQIVLKAVKGAGGNPLGLTDLPPAQNSGSSRVGVQLRARVSQAAFPRLIAALEGDAPSISLEDVSALGRLQASDPNPEIELTAYVRGRWVRQADTTK